MFDAQAIVVVVERGRADGVAKTAKFLGALNVTILQGRGTEDSEMKRLFNFDIDTFKEIVIILIEKDKLTPILDAIVKSEYLDKAGKGIVFTLPVTNIKGINPDGG